ncbi:MAG: DUF1501 domain-containing protein [Myxococcales bacterium]|nr:DUF1501 domain-containing protein [Myxococcales bacterium]
MELNRRRFLIASGGATAGLMLGLSSRAQEQTCASGLPFVITVQASGAWDPTFLVDPVADNADFTPFTAAQIASAGELRYAPFIDADGVVSPYLVGDDQQDFFAKHAARTLVFNGVDNRTVSHDVGPRVAFTGSTRDGQPTLSGLAAGLQGGDMPLAMFVSSGFASTGGLVPVTRGGSLDLLRTVADPNRDSTHPEAVNGLLQAAIEARDVRLLEGGSLPRLRRAYETIREARSGALEQRFEEIAEVLDNASSGNRGLAATAAGVLALMSSGATAAAHLSLGGFDTHDSHDDDHPGALSNLLETLNFIVDSAAADAALSERGVVVVVASDFGRTRYNGEGGKDHWPITSMMAMGVGAAESRLRGGRVIGATTPTGGNGVEALPVRVDGGSATVTEADDPDGFYLTPGHVHHALREAIGICDSGAPEDPVGRFALNVIPNQPIPLS